MIEIYKFSGKVGGHKNRVLKRAKRYKPIEKELHELSLKTSLNPNSIYSEKITIPEEGKIVSFPDTLLGDRFTIKVGLLKFYMVSNSLVNYLRKNGLDLLIDAYCLALSPYGPQRQISHWMHWDTVMSKDVSTLIYVMKHYDRT